VRAATGQWDSSRPTEGAYTAFLTFENGVVASLTYSGYGHFDTDEFVGWVSEMGHPRDPQQYGAARRVLRTVTRPEDEAALKDQRTYGVGPTNSSSAATLTGPVAYNHFGSVIVSCEGADLRPLPNGVMVYADDERWFEPLPMPTVPRSEVVDELVSTIRDGRAPLHSAEWGTATLEVCLGILESAREDREVQLCHQTGMPPIAGWFSPPAAKEER
jgi:phthalate 4,5-cis-dihydrodiol dehydrogenase